MAKKIALYWPGDAREKPNELALPSITLERLRHTAATQDGRYDNYVPALTRAGFDPDRCMLVMDFPVVYLGVGYTRGGFMATEADLVALLRG